MSSHRQWTERGLAWIGAFDSIPLLAIVETMRSLDLFKESTLSHYLNMTLSNKLQRLFEPPPPPQRGRTRNGGRRPVVRPLRRYDRGNEKAAGVARCGLSGKIDCQCNNNTPSPDNVEAAARLSSGGVLIGVPRGGTSFMLQGGDSSSNSPPRKVSLSGSLAIVWSPHQQFAAR